MWCDVNSRSDRFFSFAKNLCCLNGVDLLQRHPRCPGSASVARLVVKVGDGPGALLTVLSNTSQTQATKSSLEKSPSLFFGASRCDAALLQCHIHFFSPSAGSYAFRSLLRNGGLQPEGGTFLQRPSSTAFRQVCVCWSGDAGRDITLSRGSCGHERRRRTARVVGVQWVRHGVEGRAYC